MFLKIIFNDNTQQATFCVSETDDLNNNVILSLKLLKEIDNQFIQNLIIYDLFNISYLEDNYYWIDIPILKNLLSLLSLFNIIELDENILSYINSFSLKNKIDYNDFNYFGFQSPIKTFPRDLSTQPKFIQKFLNVADFHKRLLLTFLDFNDEIIFYVNKRKISCYEFIHHLNSDRDRIRIKESLNKQVSNQHIENFIQLIKSFKNINLINKDTFICDYNEIQVENNTTPILLKASLDNICLFSFIDSVQIIQNNNLEEIKHIIEDKIDSIFENSIEENVQFDDNNELNYLNNEIIEPLDVDIDIVDSILTFIDNENKSNKHNILSKINTIFLEYIQFINYCDVINNITLYKSTLNKFDDIYIEIIEFIISESTESTHIANNDLNYNFFEEQQKKLIELSLNEESSEIDILYKNYPDFEKSLINFNYEGDNPLCIASYKENLDLIKLLLNQGWNPNYFDSNMNNALIIACAEGHKHIVKFLLTQHIHINFQNKKGFSALHFAVNDCNHRIVKLLIENGADVNSIDNDRNSPLSIAAYKGDFQSTKLLLEAQINIYVQNKSGYDARSIALIFKHHSIAKLIEDKIIEHKHKKNISPIIQKNS